MAELTVTAEDRVTLERWTTRRKTAHVAQMCAVPPGDNLRTVPTYRFVSIVWDAVSNALAMSPPGVP